MDEGKSEDRMKGGRVDAVGDEREKMAWDALCHLRARVLERQIEMDIEIDLEIERAMSQLSPH